MATTSSVVNFVDEFNQYFHCPSKNGKCKGKLITCLRYISMEVKMRKVLLFGIFGKN